MYMYKSGSILKEFNCESTVKSLVNWKPKLVVEIMPFLVKIMILPILPKMKDT